MSAFDFRYLLAYAEMRRAAESAQSGGVVYRSDLMAMWNCGGEL